MLTADFNLRMARAVDLSHTEWLGLLLDRALTEPGDQRLLPQAPVKKLGYRATRRSGTSPAPAKSDTARLPGSGLTNYK